MGFLESVEELLMSCLRACLPDQRLMINELGRFKVAMEGQA
jgi:hypothetical protein